MLDSTTPSDLSPHEPSGAGMAGPRTAFTSGAPAAGMPTTTLDQSGIQAEELDAADESPVDELAEELENSTSTWLTNDTQAFLVSMVVHTILILTLALVPLIADPETRQVLLSSVAPVPEEELAIIEDFAFADEVHAEIGANSLAGTSMALSSAPTLAEISALPSPVYDVPVENANYDINTQIQQPLALTRSNIIVKGMTGVGTTGTDGAVDRVTYEILRSLEERPTLVVWFFDQSGSLMRRRQEIRDRFEKIYDELGIVRKSQEKQGKGKADDDRLLTSIFAYGDQVSLLTPEPTADLAEIQAVVDSIQEDTTGVERVFTALYKATEKYKHLRTSRGSRGPTRNVMFVVITDERGDDPQGLEPTIQQCRKYAIPVYVVGSPAPFGREFSYLKYIDPDPQYDQTPQWAQVDQGPESLLPERVKLGYRDNYYEEPVIDSGFGPYALSRLTYETGGIYFSIHPNRQVGRRVRRNEIEAFAADIEYFFDPEVMEKYRPDYLPAEEYQRKIMESPLRQTLVRAAQVAAVETLEAPTTRFVKRDEASFANALTAAQQQAARLEPQLAALTQLLQMGETHRDKEASLRWLAGFDLALGTVLAHKVRAEAYNAMLAKAKRGMIFEDTKNNTWTLRPENEISVGSKLEKEADTARKLLQEVASRHAGTPWGLLAKRELENPIGWKWVESFTDLNPQPMVAANNNAPPPPPTPGQDDQARRLTPPPPKRPLPKL
jgi:hypothetical protein